MGIPGFFPWLNSKYPRVITTKPKSPENIYIDVNGIIHTCCMVNGKYDRDEEKSIERVIALIEGIINDLLPTKLVYLAVDGVAPRAKSNQQRCRRISSSASKITDAVRERGNFDMLEPNMLIRTPKGWGRISSIDGNTVKVNDTRYERSELTLGAADKPSPVWDSNAISVGTPFMDKVCTALSNWVKDQSEVPFSVLFSGVRTPGEGEHKFIDFIKRERELNSQWYEPNDTHVLVSGDTDLLLLGLALHEPNVIVMRENRDDNGGFEYCTVAVLREYVCEELIGKLIKCQEIIIKSRRKKDFRNAALMATGTIALLYKIKAVTGRSAVLMWVAAIAVLWKIIKEKRYPIALPDAERILDDWLISAVFVGNDFMPHLPSIYAGQFSMSTVVDSYVRGMAKGWAETGSLQYLMNPDASLNTASWSCFMRYMAQGESATMRSKKRLTSDESWTSTYYTSIKSLTQSPLSVPALRSDMCASYVEGLAWLGVYYLTPTLASWAWYYRHYHAPTARDLLEYFDEKVKSGTAKIFMRDVSKPLKPLQQLMLVVPPASFHLLPEQALKRALEQGEDAYPVSWVSDHVGSSKHPVPIIPFVDDMDSGVAEPPNEPEVLSTPKGTAPTLAGGLVVPMEEREGCHNFTPHVIMRQTSRLTKGTKLPEITAVRRPCYIPWRTRAEENRELGQGSGYVLALKFEKRVPYSGFLQRVVKRAFGIPCMRVMTSGMVASIFIAGPDVEKVKELLPKSGTMIIDKQQVAITVEVSTSQPKGAGVVVKDLPKVIKYKEIVRYCEQEFGMEVGTIKMRDGGAIVPFETKYREAVEKSLKETSTWAISGRNLKVEMLPHRVAKHPTELSLDEFFADLGADAYIDWACSKCCTRNYQREHSCISCSSRWGPLSLPLTIRKGGENISHYEADHTLHTVVEGQRSTAVPPSKEAE
eukprot:TRINITY_DN7761_c2_g1_i1.p1 TRINITY_DN7761_c2_g1~~TRINITY_DN7761_c2_g1_i1.p1  ORF type:complete len:932 (+),score=188.24 TRINITY_DN7761_c2_g1_i1:52-2847(+)